MSSNKSWRHCSIILRGLPWSLLRTRLEEAGHTRLQGIEDYDLWGYALAMIQQGDLARSEVLA